MSQNYTAVYDLTIKEHHLDTFGHMNNATYLEILEEARWELISERGYGLAEIQKRKQGPVILEVNLKFFKEIRLRTKVKIETFLVDYKGKIATLKQKILFENGDLAAEAIFVFGLFDLKERKLIDPTKEWRHAIGMPPE